MSSPVARPSIAESDPLSPTSANHRPHGERESHEDAVAARDDRVLTFKRRAATRPGGATATATATAGAAVSGLLGGIMSRSAEQQDLVRPLEQVDTAPPSDSGPGLSRPGAPSRIADLPAPPFQHVYNSGTVEQDGLNSLPDRFGSTRSTIGNWTRSVSRSGGAGPSYGGARQPPLRDPLLSPESEQLPPSPGQHPDTEQTPDSTPLPTLPIIVLCVAMLGEFLSASLSSPFLYFMIESFGVGQGPGGGGEATVGFWTGIVSAVFFLSQFLTSLLWMSVAEKHGRRAVLCASLVGNGLTVIAFGTSKNLASAITARFAMGLFNGAVGVARSAVQSITDPSNEARAITYMGLCWGLGGIVGSIIGGLTESPVKNYPGLFGDSKLFAEYPYLLPCLIAGSVTLSGGILSLWLNRDGGPRTGAIRLTEKNVDRARRSLGSVARGVVDRIVSFLSTRRQLAPVLLQPTDGAVSPTPALSPLPTPLPDERSPFGQRRPSRFAGSAYGYNSRRSSEAGMRIPTGRRATGRFRDRLASAATSNAYAPDYDVDRGDFSFAQRLLLANEQAVFSISDLWIAREAAAEDDYSQIDYEESVFEDEESRAGIDESNAGNSRITLGSEREHDFFGYGTAPPSLEDLRGTAAKQDLASGQSSPGLAVPRAGEHRLGHSPSRERLMLSPSRDRGTSLGVGMRLRRPSMASGAARVPSIFANTGLDEHTLAAAQQAAGPLSPMKDDAPFNPLEAIPESGRPTSVYDHGEAADVRVEKPEAFSLRQLPLGMIAQYSLLALHGCTCDQVFMSFLVTPVASGGLGLKAANYAGLIALMFFFNTCWQFKFYPFVGPPNGSLSHLAMFRLGLVLYIPVYLLFPELRGLLRENSNGWVMFGMTLLSAMRYLANTCSYTAVMVLINAMSPPHLVPLANGLAQSTVSFARFVGPVGGGIIWSASIADGPTAHAWPFNYAAGFVTIALLCFAGFLHSFRIR